jgi:hypothetical protein
MPAIWAHQTLSVVAFWNFADEDCHHFVLVYRLNNV